jgi:hypothetical protein
MGKYLILVVMILIASTVVYAEEQIIMDQNLYVNIKNDISNMKNSIVSELIKNDDENMRALDNRVATYMDSLTQKVVIGAIGINMLVAGLVYYFLIKNNRNLSYESISLKRKKEVEDRAYLADTINQMRERHSQMEEFMKTQVQPGLMTLQEIADQRRYYNGEQQQSWGVQQEAQVYGGGPQDYAPGVPVENSGVWQQPQQEFGAGPWQYEQPPGGQGWPQGTQQQGHYPNIQGWGP